MREDMAVFLASYEEEFEEYDELETLRLEDDAVPQVSGAELAHTGGTVLPLIFIVAAVAAVNVFLGFMKQRKTKRLNE